VPAGDYALFPDQPAGYQGLAAFCRTAGDTGPPRPVQNTGFRLDPGAERSCFFFFRPAEGTSPESAATGTLYLQIFACPVGITEADLPDAQDACDIDYGIMELFLGGDAFDGALTLADATPTQNAIGWTDLPLGNYYLAFRAGEAVVFSATDADALGSPVSNTATSYPVTLTARNPEVLFQVYHLEYPPLLDSGSLTIQVWNCPPEMIPQAYDPAACAPAEPGVGQPLVTSPDGAVYVFDVQGDGGLYVINVLPYGVYFVGMVDSFFWTIEGLPGDSFEGSFPPIEIGPDNPDLFLTIYNFPHLNE
jgi:hypothetical protein